MKVVKTIKLYIGGKFPRTESGRSYPVFKHDGKEQYARVCQSSRKDFRNAIEAAKDALGGWSSRTAFNRSQILYRMAEMMEGKREEFAELFESVLNMPEAEAHKMIDQGRDAFVFYAGFCDKFQQISGSVNNINGPYHNFTTPESMGVTSLIEPDDLNFEGLCAHIASIIASGNSLVVLLGKSCPALLAPLAEVFATSDLPGGVVNLLTGHLDELYEHIGAHREVRSINYQNENEKFYYEIKKLGVDNMKRIHNRKREALCLDSILDHVEFKTVWHPIGV